MLLVFLLSFNAQTAWAQDVTISSANDWDNFATAVNNGTSYSGQTVALTADIEVSTMVGTSTNKFCGTFIGNGHTLTFNNATATANDCAPFGYIDGATIKCLKVAGEINTGYKYAAGIAAHSYGICTIQNCHSSISVESTIDGDGTHAGFVAVHESGTLTITNCIFDGSITGATTTNCGGFVGWRSGAGLIFNNCLMAGSMTFDSYNGSATFNRNGSSTLNNCYYKTSYGDVQGTQTTATSSDLQTLLGSCWQVNGESVEPIIDTKNLATATISGISSSFNYTGKPLTITYTITAADGSALSEGTDYTATITKDGSVSAVQGEGDYTLTITAIDGSGYTGTQTFDFAVSDIPLGMSVDSEIEEGTVGHYYVNMPTTGDKKIEILEGFTSSFKVYDDGGKDKYFSDNCNGTLTIIAPENHYLLIHGSVKAYGYPEDYLQYHDGDNTSFDDDEKCYGNDTEGESIEYKSSTRSVTLHFVSDDSDPNSGIDLTVSIYNPNTKYAVNINSVEGGTATANSYEGTFNETITLTAVPEDGYLFHGASVTDDNNNVFEVQRIWYADNGNKATFTMPNADVTVTPKFSNEKPATDGLFINMPKTGNIIATIPDGVQSFKVYDDGGQYGNYSNECDGTLTITAPENHYLKISGKVITAGSSDGYLQYHYGKDTYFYNENQYGNISGESINLLVNSGQSITLRFTSNENENDDFSGIDLTVKVLDPNEKHTIKVNTAEGGSVTANPTEAIANQTVALTAEPEEGFVFTGVNIHDEWNEYDVLCHWNSNIAINFAMPPADVTVTPKFSQETAADELFINMPKTGNITASIPDGVQSFKVYDDGGEGDDPYSENCDGTLTITAPEGHLLLITGKVKAEGGGSDYLQYHEGTSTTFDKETQYGYEYGDVPINFVSSGQSITLRFKSDDSYNYSGLDLTVTLIPVIDGNSSDPVTFTVTTENATVIYKRNFTANQTSTIMLPFDINASQANGTFYTLTTIDTENWTADANKVEGTIAANTPYLFKPSEDITSMTFSGVTIKPTATVNDVTTDNWHLIGTYTTKTWDEDGGSNDYGFAAQDKGDITAGEFVKIGQYVRLKPTRAYLHYGGTSKSTIPLPDRIQVTFHDETASVVDPVDPQPTEPTDITTPISELPQPADNVKVWSCDHTIYIAAQPNTTYRIIDAAGRVLKTAITATDRDEISLGNRSGIAIVIINNKSFKISY